MKIKTVRNLSLVEGLSYKKDGTLKASDESKFGIYQDHYLSLTQKHGVTMNDVMKREVTYMEEIDQESETGKITLVSE